MITVTMRRRFPVACLKPHLGLRCTRGAFHTGPCAVNIHQPIDQEKVAPPAVVPAEPTEAMLDAARDWAVKTFGQGIGNAAAIGCWKAMYAAAMQALAAAPTPAGQEFATMQALAEAHERIAALTTDLHQAYVAKEQMRKACMLTLTRMTSIVSTCQKDLDAADHYRRTPPV
jgi:hypothetical protein